MSEPMKDGIDAVATALLHSLWQGAVVAAGLFVVLKVVPRSAATLRYGWGLAAMGVLVAAMVLTFLSAFELAPFVVDHQVAARAGVASNIGSTETFALLPGAEQMAGSWQIWAVAAWMVGAAIFSLRLGGAWWGVRQLREESFPVADEELVRCFERVRARLGIPRSVVLRASRAIDSPLTLGWWKPVVLVPVSMISALPPNHWEPIFAHELMHVRRCDFLFNMAMVALRSALFYHPAVAWIVRQIQIEREAACDGQVVRTTGYRSKVSYASALLAVDEWRRQLRRAVKSTSADLSLAIAGGPGDLKDRIERLVKAKDRHEDVSRVSKVPYTVALMLALAAALCGWLMGPSASGHTPDLGDRHSSIHIFYPPGGEIPAWGDLFKNKITWEVSDRQLFASRLVLQVGDRIVPFGPKDPPLFAGIDNAWIIEHELNYLDGELPFRDPDGDGFSNREEFDGGTSPLAADEHPPLIDKLRFVEKRQQLYRVKFSALPDGRSVQLNRLRTANWEPKTFILRVGELSPDGRLEVLMIDETVQVRHLPTGQKSDLSKGAVGTFSIDFARLRLAINDNEPFMVKVGDGFRLDADSGEWKLEAVTKESATVRQVGAEKNVTVRP